MFRRYITKSQLDALMSEATEQRIEWLTKQKLQPIAKDLSGWETLYRDPRDCRLWELTYPQSGMHGGGPRRLQVLSRDETSSSQVSTCHHLTISCRNSGLRHSVCPKPGARSA